MTAVENLDYRVEHLRDRLAREDVAELGVRVEARGAWVMVWGVVADDAARAAVLRIAGEELEGVPWHDDLTVHRVGPPGPAEVLS
ncbi:BON domain-containing protein [Streptomyces sp. NRRL F-2664]|uniref:BON domain-containing protein n=1 Tax=Streptomyces sp. NRRL F-2664 TaxID=1463842 RepID=UPI0004C8001D|nr:BON domain-containing protein [Streptomyces sp. NRRL F-2664]